MISTLSLFSRKRITILVTLILFGACPVIGQLRLIDIQTTKCLQTGYGFKPFYRQTWLNDSILQVVTIASANCAGVYNPRIATFGPILSLKFDDHMPNGQIAECDCVFKNTWTIKGLKKKDKYIILQNEQLSSIYNSYLLNELLRSYSIDDNKNYFYLKNVVDKKGFKQGNHEFKDCDWTIHRLYKDGKEITGF